MPETSRTTHSSIFTRSIPELRRWAAQERLDHRKLNEPVEAINAMVRGVAGPHQPPMAARGGAVSAEPATTVVLVEAPDVEESSILKIRRVAYADPPVPEEYVWDGEEFDAYPAFGLKLAGFAGLEWPPPRGLPNVEKTAFLKARLVDGFWLVDRPAPFVAQFIIADVFDEHLNCSMWTDGASGTGVGSRDILVALPYMLRYSPFHFQDRGDIHYTYNFEFTHVRVARVGEVSVVQRIVPKYLPGDIIYAVSEIHGNVRVNVGAPPTRTTMHWVDMNLDSRAWARKA